MNFDTVRYVNYEKGLPQTGNHILAQQRANTVIVYQAFNPNIAKHAVSKQKFGGAHYKFSRMSWIKPNFLWMMYRCGWAKKENQERVLAIEINKTDFDFILSKAVFSSFKPELYTSREEWQEDLKKSKVRLQWDPDHNPKGGKLERKAIQLGLKGNLLREFVQDRIVSIEDITAFVHEQRNHLKKDFDQLQVMRETVYNVQSEPIKRRLMIAD
jgi:hypothetical protein